MGRKTAGFVSFVILLSLAYLAFGQTPAPPTGVTIGTAPTRYTLTVSKSGDGLGTVTGMGITCGTDCSQSLNPLTNVELTAAELTGSVFVGWTGDCVTISDNVCSLNMNAAKNVTAVFDVAEFAVAVTKSGTGLGTVTSNPAGISCDPTCVNNFDFASTVILTAIPTPPSVFTAWTGDCVSAATTCPLAMTTDRVVNAQFTLPPTNFILTVTKPGTGVGTVTSSPSGINCGATCSASFADPTVVTLTAVAGAGSTFDGWSGAGCSGTGTCIVTMSAARNVVATFTVIPVVGCSKTFTLVEAGTAATVDAYISSTAVVGDVLCLPAGSFTWTTGLTINKAVTLKGSGPCTGTTTFANPLGRTLTRFTACPTSILNNFTTGHLINVTEQVGNSVIIRDLHFIVGTGPAGTHANCGNTTCAQVNFAANSAANVQPIVVRDNYFPGLSSGLGQTAVYGRTSRGVIARNTFIAVIGGSCLNTVGALRVKNESLTFQPWAAPPTYGIEGDPTGTGNLYFEDNYLVDVMQNDGDDQSRIVWRGNFFFNSHLGGHGLDSSRIGQRHRQTYFNRFDMGATETGGCGTGNFTSYMGGRGGTGLQHHNSVRPIFGGFSASTSMYTVVIWILDFSSGSAPPATIGCWGAPGELAGESYPAPHQLGWGWSTAGSGGAGACAPHRCPTQVGSAPLTTIVGGGTAAQDPEPLYNFGNFASPAGTMTMNGYTQGNRTQNCGGGPPMTSFIVMGRDVITETTAPAAATVVASGAPVGSCPSTSLRWVTNEGLWNTAAATPQGRAYKCSGFAGSTGTWSLFYTPYTYPHPLVAVP